MPDTDTITLPTADLAQLEHLVETLEEAIVDQQLAADERGWAKPGDEGQVINREEIRRVAARARVAAVVDPLIRRAVNLRIAYVWGSGVTIGAAEAEDGGQDVNAVVQAFLKDQAATFASPQACEERERALMCAGNVFLALPTDPLTGRVQVRRVPDSQVDDVLTDPEDVETPWFYKRTFTQTSVQAARDRATGVAQSMTMQQTRTIYYPALGYWPKMRPRTINGHEIAWDTPVIHVHVNRPDGSKWGTSDLTAALDWSSGYKNFLVDWAKLVRALSQFAFRATAKTGRGAAQVRERLTAAPTGGADAIGGTAITPEGQKFEAIGKSGATIDSNSGRPMAAMVAAGTDVPVTMLLADPGVTGARATAETLDKPLELVTRMRRDLDATVITRVLDYVIDSAIKAPRGALRGTRTVDQVTGREVLTLTGDQERGVFIDWPSLEDVDLETIMKAIKLADDLDKLPPLVIARLALIALDVDNVDDVLMQVTDDEGNFVPPADSAAARSALASVNDGGFPEV